MKKTILLSLLFLISSLYSFGQNWYDLQINNIVSLKFPSKPDLVDSINQKIYSYSGDGEFFMVQFMDFSNQPNFQVKKGELNQLYDGAIKGTLEASSGNLVNKREFETNGIKGIEIEYTSTANPNLPDHRFKRTLYFNKSIITYEFWTYSTNNNNNIDIDKEKFFNSLSLKSDSKLSQFTITENDQAYNIGYSFGKIATRIALIGLIVGVIALIIYYTKRRKNI